jgi:hypothetical protein
MKMKSIGDIYAAYRLVKAFALHWTKFDAYKLGIIDENGKKIRSPETKEEKDSYNTWYRMVFNLKRLLQVVVGKNINIQRATALLLLREGYESDEANEISNLLLRECKITNLNESISDADDKFINSLLDNLTS